MLAGIIVSLCYWWRLARRDDRLLILYFAALIGAFLGAKILYLLAEGWIDLDQPDRWLRWATGKSILGALPGGYAGVEIAKRLIGYQGVTGDWFALIAPVGIILGRIGCWWHGCCLGRVCAENGFTLRDAAGVARWPAVPVEIVFNTLLVAVLAVLRWKQWLAGQHFHLYLMAYGAFRFGHEFLRDTPRWIGPFSGYQLAALAVAGLGFFLFRRRSQASRAARFSSASA
jgi:phosphatidylglycerol:prolipoprotein diacylglycerol transferase